MSQRSGDPPAPTSEIARIGHDPDAFEAFYRRHLEPVQRFVARRIDDPYLAADLTTDVFLAAIESAPSYQPARGAPIGWLFGVARTVVAAEHRRSVRERRAVSRIPPSTELIEPDEVAAMHARIDAEASGRDLYLAMERLSAGDRAVLELVALDGLAVREAARALAIRPVTARVRLHRARRLMQEELGGDVADNQPRPMEASP